MRKFSLKIIILFSFLLFSTGLVSASDFKFNVHDRWNINGWSDYSAGLTITGKSGPGKYTGILTISYVKKDILVGEKLNKVFETVLISVNKRNIEIAGLKVTGDKDWELDTFTLKSVNNDVLVGSSRDEKESFFKNISFIRAKASDKVKSISDELKGKWYLSDRFSKDLLIGNLTVTLKKDNILHLSGEAVKKDIIIELAFDGKWTTEDNFLFVALTGLRTEIGLNYSNEKIKKMSKFETKVLEMKLKPKMDSSANKFRSVFLKDIINKRAVFRISQIKGSRITIIKDNKNYIFHRKM